MRLCRASPVGPRRFAAGASRAPVDVLGGPRLVDLFVRNVPRSATADDVRHAFETVCVVRSARLDARATHERPSLAGGGLRRFRRRLYAQVSHVSVPLDKKTRMSRGFAVVTVSEFAVAAASAMHRSLLDGAQLFVSVSDKPRPQKKRKNGPAIALNKKLARRRVGESVDGGQGFAPRRERCLKAGA
ncbi:hypothetical protein M885DRAFT_48258 [Pelagophyceae sp. CCMP2097]|nr:hypothetical protein M885DRAFT_48258 [Pelagophyceae sp. CCMP2097]